MAGPIEFDPNFVRYSYVSRRILAEMEAQISAGASRWRPSTVGFQIPVIPLTAEAAPREHKNDFDLVRTVEQHIDFGSASVPSRYCQFDADLTGYSASISQDGYRVALYVARHELLGLVVLVGSLSNVLGTVPSKATAPHGFFPSFAPGLAPLFKVFREDRRRLRPEPLPRSSEAADLVRDAAWFALELEVDNESIQLHDSPSRVACELWYEDKAVTVGSVKRGVRRTFDRVFVGTPLWIRDLAPTQFSMPRS